MIWFWIEIQIKLRIRCHVVDVILSFIFCGYRIHKDFEFKFKLYIIYDNIDMLNYRDLRELNLNSQQGKIRACYMWLQDAVCCV